jgi:DUF4097 and DUF4098 domain-containing protein YvlB
MKPTMVSRAALGLSLAVVSAWPAAATAQRGGRSDSRSQIDTTFAFSKSGQIDLTLVSGEVRVTAWARNDAQVVAATNQGQISALMTANRITLGLPSRLRRGTTTYDLKVPIGVRVSVTTVGGNITVSGTRGDVSLNTVTGAMDVSDVNGNADVQALSAHLTLQRVDGTTRINAFGGSVTIDEISGDLDVNLVGGPTHVERGDLRNLKFNAVGGSLDFAGKLAAQGRHTLETLTGNITLRLPSDFGANIEFETFNGHIRPVDFPVTLQPGTGDNRAHTKDGQDVAINGGGARISIQTFSGDVVLRKLAAGSRKEE